MTANWKVVRNTFIWLLIAVMTLGIVIASPYAVKSSAASQTQTVVVAKATTGTWGAVKNGKIDTSVTGVYKNKYGWWYVKKGLVQFQYTGIQKNQYGWWRIEKGKVNFNATGVYKNEYGWWRVEKGKVNFKANAIYQNKYGWWKTTKGKVTFKEEGVFKNDFGWWYVKDSKVDFDFNGLASNKNGLWYIENGKVNFDANGSYTYHGKNYMIEKGKATETSPASDDKKSDDPTRADRKEEAVEVVKEVLKDSPISRAALIEYLTDEKLLGQDVFTKEEATYGVDHADVNWNNVALLAATEYLLEEDAETPTGFSRDLLKAVLEEDKFTAAEVANAMSVVDKDYPATSDFWNKSALISAQDIVDELKKESKTVSRDDLKKVLKEELLFTDAQAAYGAQYVKL